MEHDQSTQQQVTAKAATQEPGTFVKWIQDPMGQIIASSVAVIGSFGIVLSGSWFIHLALS
jgi:hypothetical protein